MTEEISLWCCGVKVRMLKHIIDEFNESGFTWYALVDGDKVVPEMLTALNHFCIAKQKTQEIINKMMEEV